MKNTVNNSENNRQQVFPAIAREGINAYADNMNRRYELLDGILQCAREGNTYLALQYYQERNQIQIPGRLQDPLTEWKYDLIQTKALIIHELREKGISDLWLDRVHTEYSQRLERADKIDACKQIGEEMVREFCEMVSGRESNTYSILVQKVMLTVDMDLRQNLTLQFFAAYLNVNDSYLSNLFRKEVGMTLTEYVTEKRIGYAKNILVTTQHPVKTIAKQVGIEDVHYFSRIFKKRTGKTPSEYRAMRRSGKLL